MKPSLFPDRDWICLFGPSVVVSGFAGMLVDRVETTRLLGVASVGGALVSVAPAHAGGLSALVGFIGLLALIRLKQQDPATDIAPVPPN